GGAEAEDGGAGQEVPQRLLLDRVDGDGVGPAVGERDQAAALVLADVTKAVLALGHRAGARAGGADDALALAVPVAGRMGHRTRGFALAGSHASRAGGNLRVCASSLDRTSPPGPPRARPN